MAERCDAVRARVCLPAFGFLNLKIDSRLKKRSSDYVEILDRINVAKSIIDWRVFRSHIARRGKSHCLSFKIDVDKNCFT